MNHQFVVMWCNEGLEYVGDVTADQGKKAWAKLKGEEYHGGMPNLMHMRLRAQFNSQRHYEIYFVDAVDGITEDDIREMFTASPQTAADTVREKGECFYSDRLDRKQQAIV
jgi:hypothetical protein